MSLIYLFLFHIIWSSQILKQGSFYLFTVNWISCFNHCNLEWKKSLTQNLFKKFTEFASAKKQPKQLLITNKALNIVSCEC